MRSSSGCDETELDVLLKMFVDAERGGKVAAATAVNDRICKIKFRHFGCNAIQFHHLS